MAFKGFKELPDDENRKIIDKDCIYCKLSGTCNECKLKKVCSSYLSKVIIKKIG